MTARDRTQPRSTQGQGMRQVVVLLAAGLAGCVSAKTFRSGSAQVYLPTNPVNVLVFYAVEDVKRPYEVIGEIMTEGSSGFDKNEGDLIKKSRNEAAKLGAHANRRALDRQRQQRRQGHGGPVRVKRQDGPR